MRGRAPVQSWRAPELGGLDLLHGTFTTHAFARHTHDTYSIGLLGRGAMTFDCRGATHTLRPGLIGVIHPDEVHTGHAEYQDGWTYRNFYPAVPLFQSGGLLHGRMGGGEEAVAGQSLLAVDAPESQTPGRAVSSSGTPASPTPGAKTKLRGLARASKRGRDGPSPTTGQRAGGSG